MKANKDFKREEKSTDTTVEEKQTIIIQAEKRSQVGVWGYRKELRANKAVF